MGETGSYSDGQGHAQYIFNPIFCWGEGCLPSLLFDLRPNYGGGVMKIMGASSKRPRQALLHSVPRPCSRPLLTHAFAGDPWTLRGRSLMGSCSPLFGVHKVWFVPFKSPPANMENSAVVTGLERVSFHSNPEERQCQRMLKLPHNCTHLTH